MDINDYNTISLRNVSKTFHITDIPLLSVRDYVFSAFKPNPSRAIRALHNINLDIQKGEFLGVIGKNGSGKSTLLHLISGVYPADEGGKVHTKGKFIRLSLGIGFNGELSARDNIYVNASILGLSTLQIDQKFNEIIAFSELSAFVDTPVKYFSTGMSTRLAFAIALHAEADIFLMDEFFGGVGDAQFQAKCQEVFHSTFIHDRTIVHVGHNLDIIREHSDRVLVLHQGEMVALGNPEEMIELYSALLME